jgi:hypothetical protein
MAIGEIINKDEMTLLHNEIGKEVVESRNELRDSYREGYMAALIGIAEEYHRPVGTLEGKHGSFCRYLNDIKKGYCVLDE